MSDWPIRLPCNFLLKMAVEYIWQSSFVLGFGHPLSLERGNDALVISLEPTTLKWAIIQTRISSLSSNISLAYAPQPGTNAAKPRHNENDERNRERDRRGEGKGKHIGLDFKRDEMLLQIIRQVMWSSHDRMPHMLCTCHFYAQVPSQETCWRQVVALHCIPFLLFPYCQLCRPIAPRQMLDIFATLIPWCQECRLIVLSLVPHVCRSHPTVLSPVPYNSYSYPKVPIL